MSYLVPSVGDYYEEYSFHSNFPGEGVCSGGFPLPSSVFGDMP